ncbi:TRAP transporter large permease [Brevibacterium jeotgali]|uniref:TRAP transporter, DctM subunit n=1 Tax=Brevibacterium jeotgali TaxID=1262550 RepID=A0A2H1L844_9MICO|nr:TRAP transporter large permease subunit [Brevibacterium jeotgali]TWC01620.1 tripartite ATP-independent transporter DctM subunit [Brevibacterium jeotgali]SMY13067.1 TRAP transporter, DctM subunit [Brevibacterium jeotgali]
MEPIILMVVLGAVVVLLALLATGIPVAFALAAAGSLGLLVLSGTDILSSTLGNLPYQATAQVTLVVIPMFVLMGVLAEKARIAEDVFILGHRMLRRLPGGLALASLFACAAFGAVSGSSVATTATIGRMSIGQMQKYGYSTAFAAGVVAAGGTLSFLIPPSIVLVVYALMTGESVGRMLTAGIVPGIVTVLVFGTLIITRSILNPESVGGASRRVRAAAAEIQTPVMVGRSASAVGENAGGSSSSTPRTADDADALFDEMAEKRRGYSGAVKIAILFTVVIGGIYTGILTATESAAAGATVAFIIILLEVSRVGFSGLMALIRDSFSEAASVSSFIFAILIGASIFTYFLVSAGVPREFANWVIGMDPPPYLIIILLLALMIPLGMFLDSLSILLIVIPLAYPVVTGLGFDGVWFGILMIKLIELGLITPPVGMNVFVLAGTKGVTLEDAFKGVMWFIPMDVAVVAILFVFPDLVTWLPDMIQN